ncbi:MAG TPA: hypothetical protein DCZ94_21485 [Lentisphaeria bacterium]|nr:hypothetical protein [Lentisphaeria bacterium]
MVTQKTISRNIGVSQAAVSYALTGYRNGSNGGRISKEIRDDIIKEASRLKYNPRNPPKKRKKQSIALLNSFGREGFWFPGLLKGIQDYAIESSYLVTHHIFHVNDTLPEQLISSVDGFVAVELPRPEELERIARHLPVVLLNINDSSEKYDSILPDHYNGIRKAVRHLYGLGHRKFGFFGVRDFPLHHAERYGAYQQAVSELNLPSPDPSWIFTPFRRESSMNDLELKIKETLSSLKKMKDRPTAMIFAADAYALAFMRFAVDMGINIPKDMSIVGFDDVNECESSMPSLSSIAQPLEKMGRLAAKYLIGRINGNNDPAVNIRVATEFKMRNSIAAPVNN